MHRITSGSALVAVGIVLLAVPGIARASGHPSIAVTSPADGVRIRGTALTVHFRVRDFRLVPGAAVPAHLSVPAGHIQARLDGGSIDASTDITASTVHTWSHLRTGHHMLTAWLANTMNVPIPGVAPATLIFTVAPRGVAASPRPRRTTAPGISRGPRTGGADGVAPDQNHNLILTAILSLILGSLLFSVRRFTLGAAGGSDRRPSGMSFTPASAPATFVPITSSQPPMLSDESGTPPAHTPDSPVPPTREEPGLVTSGDAESPGLATALDSVPETGLHALSRSRVREGDSQVEEDSRVSEALEAARQWPDLIGGLAARIDRDAQERRQLLERITSLEQALGQAQEWRRSITTAGSQPLTPDDLSALRFVAAELLRDPDHIVTLGAVSQYASKMNQVVEEYARLYDALYRSQQNP